MKKENILRYILIASILVSILISTFMVIKHHKQVERDRQLEARFDRFMGYLYPSLKEISEAAYAYKRIQISLMYDYIANRKGRYVYETVKYYDGGYFSMKEFGRLEMILLKANMLLNSQLYTPIYQAPPSRIKERDACHHILYTIEPLRHVDIYDYDIAAKEKTKQVEELFDSLNMVIQSNFFSLIKYKDKFTSIDLNSINEAEFDLNNY